MTVHQLIQHLGLLPHPEGGYYRETYRSGMLIPASALPAEFGGERNVSTAIYFLIEEGNFSAFHKIKSDETWHFYAGDALEVVEIIESGALITTLVGNRIDEGQTFQYTVKAGNWFGSRVAKGGSYSLVGCTVAPGFDFKDFEMANRLDLLARFPEYNSTILALTRS